MSWENCTPRAQVFEWKQISKEPMPSSGLHKNGCIIYEAQEMASIYCESVLLLNDNVSDFFFLHDQNHEYF